MPNTVLERTLKVFNTKDELKVSGRSWEVATHIDLNKLITEPLPKGEYKDFIRIESID